jgi:hypothetical protein
MSSMAASVAVARRLPKPCWSMCTTSTAKYRPGDRCFRLWNDIESFMQRNRPGENLTRVFLRTRVIGILAANSPPQLQPRSPTQKQVIAASRTRLWLASEWGCRERRLSNVRTYATAADGSPPDCFPGASTISATPTITRGRTASSRSPRGITLRNACTAIRAA